MNSEIYYEEVYDLNVKIQVIKRKNISKDPRLFFLFYSICRKYRPDIIHVWGNMPAFYALPASLFLNIPIVNSQITDSFDLIKRFTFYYLTHLLNFKFARILISNSLAGLKSYRVDTHKSRVIYNGVSANRFNITKSSEEIKNELGITTKDNVIMVGSFSKYKNYDLFVALAKHYLKQKRDITFICIGEGENRMRISQRIKEEMISNILLLGTKKNIEEIISICSVGVLFSPYGEGLSNAIIEYCALGKPVIASNLGGNPEIIENGKNGFLLKNDTHEEAIDKLNILLNDIDLRNKMGATAKEIVHAKFNIDTMVNSFIEAYNQCKKS